jgi:integrase
VPRRPQGKQVRDAKGRVVGVRGKAANAEGSVYIDGDRWRASWRDENGALHKVSARTRELVIAKREMAKTEGTLNTRSTFGKTTTVAQLAAWWVDTIAVHRVRATSIGRYRDRVRRISATIGDRRVVDLRHEHLATWQAELLSAGLAPKTVADTRGTMRQVLAEAMDLGLIAINPMDRVKPPTRATSSARALQPDDARQLITAARTDRLGAAVALLFVQGWRVSEVLGLAWDDIDETDSTATIRRAAVYVDGKGKGMTLGPTKTAGAQGVHYLAPGVLKLLAERRRAQAAEQLNAGAFWETVTYQGEPVRLVFTTHVGALLARQAVTRTVKRAAEAVDLDPATISTHTGRRTVVTALYATEGIDLADVARHVGHSSPATTAGYVRNLGQRPRSTAEAAARSLDVT